MKTVKCATCERWEKIKRGMSEEDEKKLLSSKGWKLNNRLRGNMHPLTNSMVCDICAKQCMFCKGPLAEYELQAFKHCGLEACVVYLANQNKDLRDQISELEKDIWRIHAES